MSIIGCIKRLMKFGKLERRRYERVEAVGLRFKILDPDYRTDMIDSAELSNISMGGCCFRTDKWVPEKALMLILFAIPVNGEIAKIEVTGEAVRVQKIDVEVFEIAVCFLNFSQNQDQTLLKEYIYSLLQQD